MTLNDRFTEYRAEAATSTNYCQELPKDRRSSSANRRLVEELANRACVIEALRENKSLEESFECKEEGANARENSSLYFKGKKRNLSVHDRLGHFRGRGHYLPVHDRLGYVRGRNRNLSVHDRLGHAREKIRRNFKSGVSPLHRDEFEFQKYDFEKKKQIEFRRRDNYRESLRSSNGNIYVKIRTNRFQHKVDMDNVHIKVTNRADPAGIFYYHNGIRYYQSEIFIWITEWQPYSTNSDLLNL